MDITPLLLAQEGMTAEAAHNWVGVLQAILKGGVPLICLAVACVIGWAYWKQLKRNNALEKDFRDKMEADARERLAATEALLREMLDRDREANEAQQAATRAVEGFTLALKDHAQAEEAHGQKLYEIIDRLKDLERRFRDGR